MRIRIDIDADTLKEIVVEHLKQQLGDTFDPNHLKIETRSKQNFKSEWEVADFRATYEQFVLRQVKPR